MPGKEKDACARPVSGQLSVYQEKVKDFGERNKTKLTKNNKIPFFLRKKLHTFWLVLAANLDVLLSEFKKS